MYTNEVCLGCFVARSGAFVAARALQSTEKCSRRCLSFAGAHERQLLALVRAGWHWSECTGANACVSREPEEHCLQQRAVREEKEGKWGQASWLAAELAETHTKEASETSLGEKEDTAAWHPSCAVLACTGSLRSKRCHGTREQRLQMASNEVQQKQKPSDLRLLP